ncbi:MAG: hypothetical protein JWL96_4581 [Sphingomonas bacterium]|nr:hypothetical protein [Sphingomonas bacterium]
MPTTARPQISSMNARAFNRRPPQYIIFRKGRSAEGSAPDGWAPAGTGANPADQAGFAPGTEQLS